MSKPLRFEVYKDKRMEWRWRLVHRNSNILADSAEGYVKRKSAIDSVHRLLSSLSLNLLSSPGIDIHIIRAGEETVIITL